MSLFSKMHTRREMLKGALKRGASAAPVIPSITVPSAVFAASPPLPPTAADLSLTVASDNPFPTQGNTVTITVTIANAGPATATNVVVIDNLPANVSAGLTFLSATPSQGTYDSTIGAWSVGTLTPAATAAAKGKLSAAGGDTATLGLQVALTSISLGYTATISRSDQPDPKSDNNTGSLLIFTGTPTPQMAELALTQTVDKPGPNVGEAVTFTLTLKNNGFATATGVRVSDMLPAALTFVSAMPSGTTTYNSSSGVWTVGSLANGISATLTLRGLVTSASIVTNTAMIAHSDQPDPKPSNNSASATITPRTSAP